MLSDHSSFLHSLLSDEKSLADKRRAEVKITYGPGGFNVVQEGSYVRCALTGVVIPISELLYWNVEKQEAYKEPSTVFLTLWEKKDSKKETGE